MKFDIIEWCVDNFNKEELQWISETSEQILVDKYWKDNLPESDFSLQSDGFSEPFEYNNGCSSVQPDFILQG